MSSEAASPVRWLEISVETERDAIDDVAVLLGRHCRGGAVVDHGPPEAAGAKPPHATVKGYLAESDSDTVRKLEIALLLLSRGAPISEPRVRLLNLEDWAESWKAHFPVRHIGARLVVVPTWRTYQARPRELVIHLDPGMAFGTGLHSTTRLCMVAMERLVKPGWRVLDVGTGSGILAIAGALLGASSVDALDTDSVAVEVARANVRLNDVEGVVRVAQGTLGDHSRPEPAAPADPRHDLVVANILAEVISDMAPNLASAARDAGFVIASGILSSKADKVVRDLDAHGLTTTEVLEEEDWVALVAHHT